jgi:hypothetical protein
MRFILITIFIFLAGFFAAAIHSCIPRNHSQEPGESVVQQESSAQVEGSVNWSTVSPEDLWAGVFELYESDGPSFALSLIEKGIANGVVTHVDADQVRAEYLYELGRMDEAFLALAQYRIDSSLPDLLRLRAEVLWGMSKYSEARRDYESLLNSEGEEPSPETLFSLARLYDDLGEWDKSTEMRQRLHGLTDSANLAKLIDLLDSIQSEDADKNRLAESVWNAALGESAASNPYSVLSEINIAQLEGNSITAILAARAFLDTGAFDISIALMLLKLDAESDDFSGFETDLRNLLTKTNAVQWLDSPADVVPSPVTQPQAVGSLLDSASALELGRGNRDKARLLAERAADLNPYDSVAYLQLAAVEMTAHDMAKAIEQLNLAYSFAPPSDVRTRIRMIQFSPLVRATVEIPWDSQQLETELGALISKWRERYPASAYYLSANAEYNGCRGYLGGLNEAYQDYAAACELPGATREMFFREACYLSRINRIEEAQEIMMLHIPSGAPLLTWASMFAQEAWQLQDAVPSSFSYMIRTRIDPENLHADYFEAE